MALDSRRGLELCATAIDRLPGCLKAALAAACAQRQGDIYRTYAMRTKDGSAEGFDNLLRTIWDNIGFHRISEQDHKKWDALAEALYPNQKLGSDRYKGGAEQAILSLEYSNDVLMAGKTQDTIHAAHEAFGSISHFLTSSIGQTPQFKLYQPGTREKVLAHPLTEAEHRRQERDLLDLEQILSRPDLMQDAVNKLRNRAEAEARIFLPIVDQPTA